MKSRGIRTLTAALIAFPLAALAQTTSTWTGQANDFLWSTGTNWTGGSAPGAVAGDIAIFDAASTPSLNAQTITLGAPITLGTLTNTGSGPPTAFTLSGGSIVFDNGLAAAQLQFGGNDTLTIASALSLNSNLSLNGSAPAARLNLTGAISATGNIAKSGVGIAVFSGGGKTFTGGFDIFSGSVETSLSTNSILTLGALDSANNVLGAGNLRVGNTGTLLDIKSSGDASNNQAVALNGSTLTAEFGGVIRLSELGASNALRLDLNSGTLDGGTNANRGTLYLSGADLAFNANGLGGTSVVNTPTLVFDTSANNTAMTVTLNGGTLGGLGTVRRTGVNDLNFVDAGTFGGTQFIIEGGRTSFGTATLDFTGGLLFADLTPITNLLVPTGGRATFGQANQMAVGGNNLATAAGATGSLGLSGFGQTFGTISLAANSRLNIAMQPELAAPTPTTLAIGALTGTGLSIFGWRGNPNSHIADGSATITDNVTLGSGNLSNLWFRGFDPGAVLGTDSILRPVDFLHTAWAGTAAGTFRWFDVANWSVDVPVNRAGATATFGTFTGSAAVIASLEGQTVPLGHLVTNSTSRLQISGGGAGGTLAFDSGVTGMASTITGTGNVTINAPIDLHNDLTVNTGIANSINTLSGAGNIAINGGGLTLRAASPNYTGDLTVNGGRLTFTNEQGLGPATNTLHMNGGEVYAGSNTIDVRTISNRVAFDGDFTAGFITFGYAGDVSWAGTRTITGDSFINFGQDFRLTGTGALVVQGGASSGFYDFGSNRSDFSGGLTVRPRMGPYTTGGANATLRSNLVTGALSDGENYFGTGSIIALAPITVATNGFATTMRGALSLGGQADAIFTGGGSVTLEAGSTLTRADSTTTDLITDGNLAINGATLVGSPNIVSNPGAGTNRFITSTGTIDGVGSFTKTNSGATFLVSRLNAGSYTVNGGILVLNGNAVVDSNSPLIISSASVHASGGTGTATPNVNRFGNLNLTGNASISVEDHTALTFSNATWTTQSLLIQNTTGIWSSLAQPTLSDTYVRFTSNAASVLSAAELASISFTGFDRGAALVPQTVNSTNYWFLAPSPMAAPLSEWRAGGGSGIDTDRNWSTATNWLNNTTPNGVGAIAAIRGLDRLLPNSQVFVDTGVTLGKLIIERGPSTFDIISRPGGSITFDNSTGNPQISVANDNRAVLSADVNLLATDPLSINHQGTQIFTLASRISGSGGIVSNYSGPATATIPDAGVIRIAGNAATSNYTGGFHISGATGSTTSHFTRRELRIAADGTLFGVGVDTGDPATSTQPFHFGESGTAWYKLVAEDGPRTINGAVRIDGNLFHEGDLTFESTAGSYVTAGFKSLHGPVGTLNFSTPIAGPGGFLFAGSNQSVNFNGVNTFSGGIHFLQSHSPTLGLGADNALGTGTITYDIVSTSNAPRLMALGGARRLSNPFVFRSPVGSAKITARFMGDITLDHVGRSQLNITPGIVTESGTTTFTSTHILEGPAGIIKNGAGILRLEAANEYLGDTEILQGILQLGNAEALGAGDLIFNGTSTASYGTLAAFGGARTVSNRVRFDSVVFGLDGTLGTLTLNPDVALGDTALTGARTAEVSGAAVFGENLNLTGSGSLTKSGEGTLVMSNGGSSYSGTTTVARGTLQVNAPGDITLGRAEPGQSFLGTGAIAVKPTSAATSGAATRLELLVADGAKVRISGNVEVSGFDTNRRAELDVTSAAGTVTGANVSTYLDATQTLSGNSFGAFRTPGDLIKSGGGTTTTVTGGVLSTPNLVIDSGTLTFAAAELATGIQNLTMGNGTLRLSQNQTFASGSELRLAGIGTIDMAGTNSLLTFDTVGSWDLAGELTISQWNGLTGTGGGTEQFRFRNDVTGLFSDTMLSSIIFQGLPGTSYAPGAVVVQNTGGFFELLPVGVSGEWDDGGSGFNWSTALNWRPDIQPNGVGASAAFGDLDATLNGKTVTVDTTNLTLGSLVFSNTQGAAFTLAGAPITFQQIGATANAVISVTGNSNPTIASNVGLQNDLLVSHQGTGTVTIGGVVSGAGRSLIKSGPGTLTLTGANTYSGGTEFLGGFVSVAADQNLGDASGALSFDGGGLRFGSSFDLAGTRAITLGIGNGTFDTDVFNTRIGQGITGTGELVKVGAGTLTLASDNTFTGDTTISAGTLQIGEGGTTGSIAGDVITNASLVLNRSDAVTFGGSISGSGTVTHAGSGTTTLTGDATHTGGTTISMGTLQIGAGGTNGSITGAILNNSALVFNRSDDLTYGEVVSGSGTLMQLGPGAVTLSGASTYTGATTVSAGTLRVDGSLGNTATVVHDGATLAGTGSIAGSVTVLSGGHIAPGDSPGTLTTGALLLNPGALLDYELNTPNVVGGPTNDLLLVNGDLTLDGTLNIATANPLGLFPGTYRLIGYTGALTNPAGTLGFGVVPDGFTPNVDLFIQTSVAAQVNLVNAKPPVPLVFWDSDDGTVANNNVVDGGSGTWLAAPGNNAWTNIVGSTNAPWLQNGFAVFTGTPGTVDVDHGSGAVTFGGAQFAVNGYTITGESLTTDLPITFIRVGDGTTAGAAYTATIDSVIEGTGGLHKIDLGTLVLGGMNTYTGGTTIGSGTLSIASDPNLGDAAGGLTLNGGTLLTTANVATARTVTLGDEGGTIDNSAFADVFSGVITGEGALTSSGAGTLTLTGENDYIGGTTITAGTLQLGDGGTSGSITGDVANNAALVFNRGDDLTFDGIISGTGSVTQAGAGTLTFTAGHDYTGGTVISAGTLQLGGGGSVAGNISNDGALVFNRADVLTFAGIVSGAGSLAQIGTGTLILTGENIYTGGTTVAAGTLQIGNGDASGSVAGDITDNSALIFNRSDLSSFGGTISGTGSVTQAGTGTLTFTTNQAYTGGTTISAGTLQLGDGGTSGSIFGDVDNNASLVFNRSDAFTFGGVISGTGMLTQSGIGSAILTGSNTYTGGTTISAGTLQLGDGGTSGSVVGDVTNNAALIFNRSDAVNFAGIISGSGSVEQAGTGTLTLATNHTYTGGTAISAGTLQLGNGGTSGSVIGNITNNGVLAFNRSDDLDFTSSIDGTGSVVKLASNTLTMSGVSTYTGPTSVNAGRLLVHGAISSTVNVAPGATLGGNGTVGPVMNAGVVSPGASLGTLTVAGDFAQQAGGALHIELDDRGGFDVLDVGGAAALAGRVDYLPDATSLFAEDLLYTYLPTGGGVTGEFDNSTQAYAGVTFETIYNADNVQVQIISTPLQPDPRDPGGVDLASCIASLDAQRALVRGTSAEPLLRTLIFTPLADLPVAAYGFCPRDPSALPTAINAQTGARFGMVNNRIAQARNADAADDWVFDSYHLREGVGFWFRATDLDSDQDGRDILRTGYDSNIHAFSMGLDVTLGDAGVLGAYLSRDDLDLEYRAPAQVGGHSGTVEDRAWNLGLYGSYWSDARWFVQGILEYGWHEPESTRLGVVGPVNLRAEGDRDARGFAASAGAGYNFELDTHWLIQPQLNVIYQRFADEAYSETGVDALSLTYSGLNADTLRGEAGVTARRVLADSKASGQITAFYAYLNYVYENPLDDRNLTAQFNIGEPFEMIGDEKVREGVRYGAGFENTWSNNVSMQLLVDAQNYGEIKTLGVSVRISKQF